MTGDQIIEAIYLAQKHEAELLFATPLSRHTGMSCARAALEALKAHGLKLMEREPSNDVVDEARETGERLDGARL